MNFKVNLDLKRDHIKYVSFYKLRKHFLRVELLNIDFRDLNLINTKLKRKKKLTYEIKILPKRMKYGI